MEWRPIEGAPKDGTQILISGGTVLYDAETYPEPILFTGVEIAFWMDHRGWWGGFGAEYGGEYWHEPTHWMPLPEPPHVP